VARKIEKSSENKHRQAPPSVATAVTSMTITTMMSRTRQIYLASQNLLAPLLAIVVQKPSLKLLCQLHLFQ
jgi:hypothetical protein